MESLLRQSSRGRHRAGYCSPINTGKGIQRWCFSLGLREQVFGYVERENAEGFSGIGRVEAIDGWRQLHPTAFERSPELVGPPR